MSDTATPGSLDSFLLDGEAPRLGSAPVIPPTPLAQPVASAPANPVAAISAAAAALDDLQASFAAPAQPAPAQPAFTEPDLPNLAVPSPSLPTPTLPTPTPAAVVSAGTVADGAAPAEPRHPMAHLMPAKSQPNETSAWAAELRAKQKAKARRTKIIVAVVFLALAAVVGPPLGKWLVDAINESGSTKPATPVATVPATTAPATTAPGASATAPAPAPTTAPAGLLGLPGQAEATVAGVNGTAPVALPTTAPAAVAP